MRTITLFGNFQIFGKDFLFDTPDLSELGQSQFIVIPIFREKI
jgi:hypothetical protein